jgi:parallel beta-helix repeat protein
VNKKTLLSAFLTAILIAGLVLASAMHLGTVQAATEVTGIISSDVTWTTANSPYTLTGSVLVNNGVTLTIQPDVTINLGNYYILVNGTLVAKGTINSPIRFNGGSITFSGFSVGWNEQTGSGCLVENAFFSSTSISSDSSVKISKSSLDAGISGGGSTIISESFIEGEVSGGLVSGNTITGEVSGVTVSNNIITGRVSGNVVSKNTITGGVVARGNCIISENTITGGIEGTGNGILVASEYVISGGYPKIEANLITNTDIGINIGVLIRDWFSANIPQIQRNLITKNSVGIKFTISEQNPYGDREPTTIQDNTISQNDIGIEIEGSFEHCTIQNNNIQDNSDYNLYLEGTSNNVDVTYNWWGTNNEQAISQSIYDFEDDFNLGTVDFVPFLTELNPEAPDASYVPTTPPSPTSTPSLSPSPTTTPEQEPSPTPSQEAALTPEQFEVILGVAIVVAVFGAGLGLLIYLIKRK